MRRAQTISLDLVAGAALFLIFVGIMLALLLHLPRYNQERPQLEFELMSVFENLEANLLGGPPAQAFYQAYRVDAHKLDVYALAVSDVDNDLLSGTGGGSNGLGLTEDGYDTCLYFLDVREAGSQPFIPMSGKVALGTLRSGSCDEVIASGGNPCEGYDHAMSVFRPVLYDTGDYAENRVVLMNVVACRK